MSRFDNRSKEEFAKDIKQSSLIENELMNQYVKWLNNLREKGSAKYTFIDHGIDNTGDFIENDKDVTTAADFILRRKGKVDRKIDIKFCRPDRPIFHLKVSQMMSYIQNDVCIVNFMGIETDDRKFCILPPSNLSQWLDVGERLKFKPFGYKWSIKFPVNELEWHYVK